MTKILLVEDNEMNQDMLSRRLLRRGFEVVFASNGAIGVSLASSEQPDLILMDMSLPVMDGWEATRLIKANPHTAAIPIIALTAHAMVGDRDKAMTAGCDDYDTKPVELARLLEKIEVLLTKPVVLPEPVPAPSVATAQQLSTPVQTSVPSESEPHRVLIVDDNDMNRDMLSRRLQRAGYFVLVAEGGEAGLALLQQQKIDLVLLDIMMPGMSGLEMLQQIRLSYTQAQLPVIMATAKDESEDVVQAFELGANDYVTKPIDLPVLLARVQAHLRTLQITPQPQSAPFQKQSTESIQPIKSRIELSQPSDQFPTEAHISPLPPVQGLNTLSLNRFTVRQTLTQDQSKHCYLAEDTETPDNTLCVVEHFQLTPKEAKWDKMAYSIFRAEVDALKTLSANSLVARLIDISSQDNQYYVVREFIQGTPLLAELKSGEPLSLRDVFTLTLNLLEIVQSLHERCIVHQSLRIGSFVRRASDQRLMLSDAGLVTRMEIALWRKSEFQSSFYSGFSTSYAAPEQFRGSAIFASDIYAIGIIILEALTGITPDQFPRDSQTNEVCWRHLITVGEGFDEILDKMICKLTKKRYMSIQRILDDLYALPMAVTLRNDEPSLLGS